VWIMLDDNVEPVPVGRDWTVGELIKATFAELHLTRVPAKAIYCGNELNKQAQIKDVLGEKFGKTHEPIEILRRESTQHSQRGMCYILPDCLIMYTCIVVGFSWIIISHSTVVQFCTVQYHTVR